jgi:hypothetical protein
MDLSSLIEDADVMEQGGWVGDIPTLEGVRLKVRSNRSNAYRKAEAQAIDRIPRQQKVHGVSIERVQAQQDSLLKDVVLLGWEGITQNDAPLPFTRENVDKLMAAAPFRDGVIYAAGLIGSLEWREEERKRAATLANPTTGTVEAAA